jgi:NarL family two-component system response regulator LiaR
MSESSRIRVMIVDDHDVLRSGLRFSLLAFEDLDLVCEARDGQEAVRLCGEYQPDVVLMDMLMPEMDGIEATQAIRRRYPQVRVLALSSFYDQDLVRRALQAGATGYLVKGISAAKLAEAIHAVHAGQTVLAPEARQATSQDVDSIDPKTL